MATTTTPDDAPRDAHGFIPLGRAEEYGTPSGLRSTEIRREDPTPRVIRSTDELLGEILKRPGQFFLAGTAMRPVGTDTWTFIEFSDGSRIEVQGR